MLKPAKQGGEISEYGTSGQCIPLIVHGIQPAGSKQPGESVMPVPYGGSCHEDVGRRHPFRHQF